MKEEKLYIHPQQYSEMLEKLGEMSKIRADGSMDTGDWVNWVHDAYGLEWFTEYRIIVDWGRGQG